MSGGEEGFLARWSRRKRGAAAPEAEPEAPAPQEAAAPPAPPPGEEAEPEFDPASLPPVETLTAESDISAFLRPRVPAVLRQAALRRIWSLDPAIRDFVGPADYAWDFNAPDGVPGFSLDLGGEATRLLAQAVGLGPAEVRNREAPPEAGEAAPPEAGAPPTPADPPAIEAEAAPPAAPSEAPAEAPEPAPLPVARRHGGARPA